VKSLKVAVKDTEADKTTANKELDAVLDYISSLKPQCESKAMTYAERKAAREAELAGLNEALGILSGEAPAVSLAQKHTFLSRN